MQRGDAQLKLFEIRIIDKSSSYNGKHLIVYGDLEIIEKDKLKYPEINNIIINEKIGAKETEFIVSGTAWSGRKYDNYDIVTSSISSYLREDVSSYIVSEVCNELQQLIDFYKIDKLIVNNHNIPKKILFGYDMNVYNLTVVTNKYIYYTYADITIMLDINDGSIISDNYFAEIGFFESKENVNNGDETLIYGSFE